MLRWTTVLWVLVGLSNQAWSGPIRFSTHEQRQIRIAASRISEQRVRDAWGAHHGADRMPNWNTNLPFSPVLPQTETHWHGWNGWQQSAEEAAEVLASSFAKVMRLDEELDFLISGESPDLQTVKLKIEELQKNIIEFLGDHRAIDKTFRNLNSRADPALKIWQNLRARRVRAKEFDDTITQSLKVQGMQIGRPRFFWADLIFLSTWDAIRFSECPEFFSEVSQKGA